MSMDSTDDLEAAEDRIGELAKALAFVGIDGWAGYCRPTCGELDEPGACLHFEQTETGEDCGFCGCPCHDGMEYDTASSASRQHWIDTGRFLTAAQVAELVTA